MSEALRWLVLRVALYVLVSMIGITAAGFVYSVVTGFSLAGSSSSSANLFAWLHVGVGVAALGGGVTLVVLGLLAPFRNKVPKVLIKLAALPLLLLPVLLVSLVGATPDLTFGLFGVQLFYLVIVPM